MNPTQKPKVKYDFPKLRVKDNRGNIFKAVRLDYIERDWLVYVVPDMTKILSALLITCIPPKEPKIPVEAKVVIAKEPHHLKLYMGLLNLKTELAILKGIQPKFFKPYDTLKERSSIFSRLIPRNILNKIKG